MTELDITTVSALADALKAYPHSMPLVVRVDGHKEAARLGFAADETSVYLNVQTYEKAPTVEATVAALNAELVDSPPVKLFDEP
jgi:succinyl-CoA synthetase beta subunit